MVKSVLIEFLITSCAFRMLFSSARFLALHSGTAISSHRTASLRSNSTIFTSSQVEDHMRGIYLPTDYGREAGGFPPQEISRYRHQCSPYREEFCPAFCQSLDA
ncbi:MAG: hypothetical protein OXE85_14530 [Roseovarius sp.]|nr:hypothetical protein [Roseovarius sp.]